MIAAIAAQYGAKLIKTDCKQAFLYGNMDEGPPIYIKVPDWWPEPAVYPARVLFLVDGTDLIQMVHT